MYEKIIKSSNENGEYMIAEDICDLPDTTSKVCYAVYYRKTNVGGKSCEKDWEPQATLDTIAEAEKYVEREIKGATAEVTELLEHFIESLPQEGWTFDYDDNDPGVAYVTNAVHDFKVTISCND